MSYWPAEFNPTAYQTRILVDRRMALGDVIMITPVLRELRRRYPRSWIQVVTDKPEALANNPWVSKVVSPTDMVKEDPWDVYINLNDAYETNVTSHYVDSMMARAFGNSGHASDRRLELVPTQDDIDAVDEAVNDIGGDYIVVHMRRWAWENKNIDLSIWALFITLLEDRYPDLRIVTVGADHDHHLPATKSTWINLNNQLSLGEIQHLVSRSRMFVGTDSGPYHVACTTDTPILLLSSHLAPEQILPWRGDQEFGKDVEVVVSGVPCVGCYSRQTPPVRNLTCENPVQWACAKSFDSMEMFRAAEKLLEGTANDSD